MVFKEGLEKPGLHSRLSPTHTIVVGWRGSLTVPSPGWPGRACRCRLHAPAAQTAATAEWHTGISEAVHVTIQEGVRLYAKRRLTYQIRGGGGEEKSFMYTESRKEPGEEEWCCR